MNWTGVLSHIRLKLCNYTFQQKTDITRSAKCYKIEIKTPQ